MVLWWLEELEVERVLAGKPFSARFLVSKRFVPSYYFLFDFIVFLHFLK